MKKDKMAKIVLVCTTLLSMSCLCSGYALTIPGIDHIYRWLAKTKKDRPGGEVSASAGLSLIPNPTPTFASPIKLPNSPVEPASPSSDITAASPGEGGTTLAWLPIDNVNWATFDQLECEAIPVGNGESRLYRHPTPYPAESPYPERKPAVLLKLKGSYYEMGYAHGWALAEEIAELWDKEVRDKIPTGAGAWYNCLTISEDTKREIEGIRDGFNACPNNYGISLTVEDIFVMNEYAWFAKCSSFAHWGTGNPLVGRNTDFIYTDKGGDKLLWRSGLVISREPAVYGHKKVVTLGLPGYIAAAVSINEAVMGFLGHAPSPRLEDYNTEYCNRCGTCNPMALSVLEILHTQTGIDPLIFRACENSIGGGIYHIFGKRDSNYAVTCVEASGRKAKQRWPVPEDDPSSAFLVVAGCAREWDDCSAPYKDYYELLVKLLTYYAPNNVDNPDVYLRSVLDIMWGVAPKSGTKTFHRFAINVKSIPNNLPAEPDIRIILNVMDDYTGYGGIGLKVRWNELF